MKPLQPRARVCALIFAAVFVAGGCQLPNVGPFVDGTAQLKAAVASSGAAVEQELRVMPGTAQQADALHNAWAARNNAMVALLRYAQSIDAIVAAGNAGAESAGKVADAVQGLASAAGVAVPGSAAAVGVAVDTAKFIYAQIAVVRAAGDLAQSLDEAQPAVERIAELMRKDLTDLDELVQAASQLSEIAIVAQNNDLSAYRKKLADELKKDRDLSKKEAREELAEFSKLMSDADARYGVYQAQLSEVENRLRAARQLINSTGAALDAWAAAHAQLAVAAWKKTTVSTKALTDAAVELRDLVKRIREL
jgi:hypothetical protein